MGGDASSSCYSHQNDEADRISRRHGTFELSLQVSEDDDLSDGSFEEDGRISMNITLLEKLIRTHPVWFLPRLQRSGATHLLQGRDTGNFIVRSSTQPMTMAISVKLTSAVEHYLLKAVGNQISLENSKHSFDSVHQLICHYCMTSDEIPVRLTVPFAISQANSRQQLRSIALLGQDFWTSSAMKALNNQLDAAVEENYITNLESQSSYSNSHNSLVEDRSVKPTSLNFDTSPKPPPRWSTSALLSNVQSAHAASYSSVVITTKKPKKLRSSMYYNDAEFFRGKRTIFDDRASDYEDIWSSTNKSNMGSTFKPSESPTFFSFKPIYSEPFDSLKFKRSGSHRKSEPNIYWRSAVCVSDEEDAKNQCNNTSSVDNIGNDYSVGSRTDEEIPHWLQYLDQDADLLSCIKFPVFTPPNSPSQRQESYRFSRYDNLEFAKSEDFILEDVISKPWDSSKWEHLLKIVSDSTMELDVVRVKNDETNTLQTIQSIVRDLAEDSKGVFGPTLKTFIACTISAKSKDPYKIMRNTRQFMTGMKNYLTGTTSTETETLRREIKKKKLEFHGMELMLEEILIDLILDPLYHYIIELLNETNADQVLSTRVKKDEELQAIYSEIIQTSSPLMKLKKLQDIVSKVQMDVLHYDETSVNILAGYLSSFGVADLKAHIDYTLALLPPSVFQDDSNILSLLRSVSKCLTINTFTGKNRIPDEDIV